MIKVVAAVKVVAVVTAIAVIAADRPDPLALTDQPPTDQFDDLEPRR